MPALIRRSASRDSVAAVRALHAAGFRVAVAVSRRTPLARPSRYAERRIDVPDVLDPGYERAIRAEVERHPYVTVLPASEPALLALSGTAHELVDKASLYEAARRSGLAVPPWRSCGSREEIQAAAREFGYPVIVNTSFNVRGEPVVCTPSDAFNCFLRTDIDYLVMERSVVSKSANRHLADTLPPSPNYEESDE